jgi:hypothetical protein
MNGPPKELGESTVATEPAAASQTHQLLLPLGLCAHSKSKAECLSIEAYFDGFQGEDSLLSWMLQASNTLDPVFLLVVLQDFAIPQLESEL